jgi:photosystem II stability/assembly factor-like uncharacterized protein
MAGRRSEKERLRRERLEREKQAKRAQQRRRRLTQAGAAFVGLLVVAVAAVAIAGGGDGDETTAGGTAAPESIADVHGLGVNPADKALYIATHSGLFRSAPGESTATRVDAPEQDLMGFSIAGPDHFVASGHPGPGMDAPPNLGMIESTDRGRTWKTLSLSGEADLHLLRASGNTAYAYDGTLRVSTDGGRTWEQRDAPDQLIDIAIDPADDEHVLASTGGGVRASSDGGRTWTDTTLAAPALLAWAQGAGPFAIDGNGRVLRSRDGGMKWKAGGTYQGQPAAFAADASDTIYVALGDGAVEASIDGGRTWQPRSRN